MFDMLFFGTSKCARAQDVAYLALTKDYINGNELGSIYLDFHDDVSFWLRLKQQYKNGDNFRLSEFIIHGPN